jgi:protein TonB
MLEVLLASRRIHGPRPFAASAASALVHAAILAGYIGVVTHVAKRSSIDTLVEQTVRYLIPPNRSAAPAAVNLQYAQASPGQVTAGANRGAKEISKNGLPMMAQTGSEASPSEQQSVAVPEPEKADNAFSIIDVDSAAVRDPSSAAPAYPKLMMDRGVEGYATMRFVVDSTGTIDMQTVATLDASHREFVEAVREVLPKMRFRPALMGTKPVRQLAEQMFKFEIKKPTSGEAPKRP